MSELEERIRQLVTAGDYRVSLHGSRELAADGIFVGDLVASIESALTLEEYPDSGRGRSVLVLQMDQEQNPVHVVWGIHAGTRSPAVLVTAYRPDPRRWSSDFKVRRRS